jgi:sugar phosphate isomerase/epimerase
MVNLSVFPKCWINDISSGKMELEEWIDISQQLSCDGLEMYYKFFKGYDKSYLKSIRSKVESLGMCIPMICHSPDFTNPDPVIRAEEIELQKRMIEVTAQLGGSFCRTLSGQKRPGISDEEGISWVVDSIKACLNHAEKHNVKLVMENHYKDGAWKYREFAQKMDIFVEIVNKIPSEWFGVQFDPSNTIVAGEDPLQLLDKVINRVMTMHASDRYLIEGAELKDIDDAIGYSKKLASCVLGQGLNDYDLIFQKLAGSDFSGWISLEDGENGLQEMLDSMVFLKNMRDKYL